MKTINIKHRIKDKSPRQFCLGNGSRVVFKSQRLADKFVADTNRYLTKVLVNFNEIYIALFQDYRRVWLVAANTHKGAKSNYHLVAFNIKKSLESADFIMEKFSTGWQSGDPYMAFVDLKKVGLFLYEAAEKLEAFHRKRDHTANTYVCMLLKERCVAVLGKLQEYDYQGTKKMPAVETAGHLTAMRTPAKISK